jgi:hypothetical protein
MDTLHEDFHAFLLACQVSKYSSMRNILKYGNPIFHTKVVEISETYFMPNTLLPYIFVIKQIFVLPPKSRTTRLILIKFYIVHLLCLFLPFTRESQKLAFMN